MARAVQASIASLLARVAAGRPLRTIARTGARGWRAGACIAALALALAGGLGPAPAGGAPPLPALLSAQGRFLLQVDAQPFFVLGAQIHNSSAWPATIPRAFAAATALGANTVEAPVYWESFEPRPGQFDTTNIDALIGQARASGVRLALLWFGSWKNGQMNYAPTWVRADPQRFPRMLDEHGRRLAVLSPFSPANLQADREAYTALLRHLRAVDGDRHTVILLQVENEPGAIGAVRDHGAAAQAAFKGPVPPEVLARLHRAGGSWEEVFGAEADETFNAWATARYIEGVARAGKAVYPLPTYVNTWLRYKSKTHPGLDYPSGGATWNVFDVWRAETPSIDAVGTDLYSDDPAEYKKVLDQYSRPDNPAFVSETGFDAATAPFLYEVLQRGGIGFSVFGVDEDAGRDGLAQAVAAHRGNFAFLSPIAGLLAQARFEGRLQAASETLGRAKATLPLKDWAADVTFGPPPWGDTPAEAVNSKRVDGRVFVVQLGPGDVLVGGLDARVEFRRTLADGRQGQLLRVEEGRYVQGQWRTDRWLNGDEVDYGINFHDQPELVRVHVGSF